MKLLTKTALLFVTISLFIFFIGGVIFYHVFISLTDQKQNTELIRKLDYIQHELSSGTPDSLLFVPNSYLQKTDNYPPTSYFTDTVLFDTYESAFKPYRILTATILVDTTTYHVQINASRIESDSLIEGVAQVMLMLVLLFLLSIFLFGRFFFGRVWADFFTTIDRLKQYDLSHTGKTDFGHSEIKEIEELNTALTRMTARIRLNYENLDEFTANVSHEIQTPLAIIQAKAELLLQDESMNERQFEMIQSIYAGTVRLSRLNKTLILMAKIQGGQFPDKEAVSIDGQIEFHLENFEDLIESKHLTVHTQLSPCKVDINPNLADILLMNLIKNAIRHNIKDGTIEIELKTDRLTISNTGEALLQDTSQLFSRFEHESHNTDSMGLGLAIVKKIVGLYNLSINYTYSANKHQIVLDLSPVASNPSATSDL